MFLDEPTRRSHRLCQELAECIHSEDDAGLRQAYRELLHKGLSRHQLLDEVIRLVNSPDPPPPTESRSDAATTASVAEHGLSRGREAGDWAIQIQPGLPDNAAQTSSEKSLVQVGADQRRRAGAGFSRLQRAFAGTSICIALAVAVVGGLLFFVRPAVQRQIPVVASLPALPTPEPVIAEARGATTEKVVNTTAFSPKPGLSSNPNVSPETPQATFSSAAATLPQDIVEQATPMPAPPPNNTPASSSTPAPIGTPAVQQNANTLPKETIAELLARGDARFAAGDLASARLYYEGAANAGDGLAALRLGQSYDPSFLAFTRFAKGTGNPATAAQWYLRADKLGAAEAQGLLRALARDLGFSASSQGNR